MGIVNRDNPHFIYGSNACSGELVDFRIADGDGSLEVLREKFFDYAIHGSGEIHAYEDSLKDTRRTYPNDNSISADYVAITGWDTNLSKTERDSALDCFNLVE